MEHYEADAKFLIKGVRRRLSVDLLLEHSQHESNEDGSEVLDEEDGFPGNLSAKVLKDEGDFLLRAVFLKSLALVCEGRASLVSHLETNTLDADAPFPDGLDIFHNKLFKCFDCLRT